MLIGITGQIGSGKTEVAKIFKKYHARIISGDKIGRDVVEKNPAVIKKLERAFGHEIVNSQGYLKRRKLGELAFKSSAGKTRLDAIVHPALLKELNAQVKDARKKYGLVVIDAALIVDWGWHKKVDYLILVQSSNRVKLDRLARKGYSRQESLKRLRSQLPVNCLKEFADRVIINNKSLAALEVQVKKIILDLTRKGLTLQGKSVY